MTTALLVCALATLEVAAALYLARNVGRFRWPWAGTANVNTTYQPQRRRRP